MATIKFNAILTRALELEGGKLGINRAQMGEVISVVCLAIDEATEANPDEYGFVWDVWGFIEAAATRARKRLSAREAKKAGKVP